MCGPNLPTLIEFGLMLGSRGNFSTTLGQPCGNSWTSAELDVMAQGSLFGRCGAQLFCNLRVASLSSNAGRSGDVIITTRFVDGAIYVDVGRFARRSVGGQDSEKGKAHTWGKTL